MSESIEESYNKLVYSYNKLVCNITALEKATMEICGLDAYAKILIRKEELQSQARKGVTKNV
jgi:hypothetical protein